MIKEEYRGTTVLEGAADYLLYFLTVEKVSLTVSMAKLDHCENSIKKSLDSTKRDCDKFLYKL